LWEEIEVKLKALVGKLEIDGMEDAVRLSCEGVGIRYPVYHIRLVRIEELCLHKELSSDSLKNLEAFPNITSCMNKMWPCSIYITFYNADFLMRKIGVLWAEKSLLRVAVRRRRR
jgi:hypothetical protein